MAVEASDNLSFPKRYEDGDDDDRAITFKRSSSSKKNPLNSEAKKSTSHSHEGQSHDGPSSNGHTSGTQKGNNVPSSKPSPMKPSAGISKALNSDVSTSSNKSPPPVTNSKLPSSGDKPKPPPGEKMTIDVKVETKPITNNSTKSYCEDSEDDNDDKPIGFRFNMNPYRDTKPAPLVVKKSFEDSDDDDLPLAAKIPRISTLGTSTRNSDDSDKKPILKVQKDRHNDSSANNKQEKPSTLPVKRPIENSNSLHSSVKKSKVSDSAASIKTKQVSGKREMKVEEEEDHDNIPLSDRMKLATSADKSLSTKKILTNVTKVNKSGSTSAASIKTKQVSGKCEMKVVEEEDYDNIPLSHRMKLVASADKSLSTKKISTNVTKVNKSGSTSAASIKTKQVSGKREMKVEEEEDYENMPLSHRMKLLSIEKMKLKEVEDYENIPLSLRIKSLSTKKISTNVTKVNKSGSTSFKKQAKRKSKKSGSGSEYSKYTKLLPSSGDGQKKWTMLVHNGVMFPPSYQPHGVKMLYKGKPVDLTPEQEEVATMYAVMRDTDYMQKDRFKENFWNDWLELLGRNHVIQNLKDCDFTPIYDWYQTEKEKKKQMTTEEKKAQKEERTKQEERYTWAIVDGVKEKVGNFRVEPPGLFRGRGEHPKMGRLKRRIHPGDITINIGKDAPVPECPIPGESWKEIRHDNTVTWLAYWNDPINPKLFKYVFLAPSSSMKGQSDKEKYEKARMLKDYIENIRDAYTKGFMSKDITKQQIAVATYLIDKLALRAGNEKDDDEADTVGCCTLKVENVTREAPNKLKFNFLGKDSIKYENTVEVELPVYNAILMFQNGKSPGDDLFDQLDTCKLNAHLKRLMPGLTAKVFRTFNASITLDDMLNKDTKDGDVGEKMAVYQHANKQVAIICNHQRTVSKSHSAQMTKLNEKIDELQAVLKELKIDLDRARKGKPPSKSSAGNNKKNLSPEVLEKKISQTNAKIEKMQRDMKTKEDLKTVALGTSKINYLDPRITVAWCKRHVVPIEKIFNKSLLSKFGWAMDVDPEFRF